MNATFKKYTLKFKFDAGTSRGIMQTRDSWFLFLRDDAKPEVAGIGECAPLPGLSIDNIQECEMKLEQLCEAINHQLEFPDIRSFPSLRFGLEMAQTDWKQGAKRVIFPSEFTFGNKGIGINGLVWMGDFDFMKKQVKEKISAGFSCIKLKIGAIDFDKELDLIRMIRKEFSPSEVEIRVDANGAFQPEEAMEKMKRLSEYHLHSIEQPIRKGQWETMASLCEKNPLPIALDEELIGVLEPDKKQQLLSVIKPQYIILKLGLLGGFAASEEWIELCEKQGTGWWVTSALESNIGLNAIAQWTYTLNNSMPQGLGTGQLYENNFDSPLIIDSGKIFYKPENEWDLSKLIR